MKFNQMEKNENVKSKVMEEIKQKKIRMRSHFVFLAEKLGLAGAATIAVLCGAILFGFIFYFIKKTGLFLFLSLGAPGTKVFFSAFPYGYAILFSAAIALAIYLANRWELFSGYCERTNRFAICFLLTALVLGSFFAILGAEIFYKNYAKRKIPSNAAVIGRIKYFSEEKIVIEDEDGNLRNVFVTNVPEKIKYEEGKFLRAVGEMEKDDDSIFHAVRVRCCDDN